MGILILVINILSVHTSIYTLCIIPSHHTMSATAGPSKKSKKESSKKVRAPSLVDSEASESSSVSDSSDIDAMDVDEVERVPARAPAKNKNSL